MGVVSFSLSPTPTSTSAVAIQLLFQSQQQSPPPPPPLLRGGGVFPFPSTRGGGGGAFSISTRTQIYFSQRRRRRLVFFRVKSVVESSSTIDDELQDFSGVPSNVLTADKEEAKAVLTLFLKKEIGLSDEAAAATISKSVPFIDHLVARLHSIHKSRYLVGRELTTLEIRDALIPYLEYLCKEHEHSLDDIMESFPNLPEKEHEYSLNAVVETFPNPPEEEREQHISEASPTKLSLNSKKKLKAMSRMTEIGTDGQLHPNTLYLVDIGLDMNQIKQMARICPSITNPCWGRHARSLVKFLLDLGVPPSDIPNILYRTPNLCRLSLSENIIPSMAYLETLGLDKSKWVKVIYHCPNLLTYSRQKVEATVDYLYELGLSKDRIGKVLTTSPGIVGLSIDDNLRPTAEYFRSMGVNVTYLFGHHPGVFNRSIECQLKPVTKFLLDIGFSIEEIGIMASRFGSLYRYSLTTNLIPKWDFFLTMDYPRSALVKCSQYFGFSLEGRIKPRYSQVRECGVKLSLSRLLTPSDSKFEKFLNRSMKKGLVAQHDSIHVRSADDRK